VKKGKANVCGRKTSELTFEKKRIFRPSPSRMRFTKAERTLCTSMTGESCRRGSALTCAKIRRGLWPQSPRQTNIDHASLRQVGNLARQRMLAA
jgi:hypothetical protein